jgi:hypothetical protein
MYAVIRETTYTPETCLESTPQFREFQNATLRAAGPFFSSFTCGARSPDPLELMLIRLANAWEQECSQKRSQRWA